jgi:thioredoxin reductase (NADPH)
MAEELITEDVKISLKETFKQLKDTVLIEVYTKEGSNDAFNEAAISLLKIMPELTDKIKVSFYKLTDENAKKRGIDRSPTILIAPDKYNIRYTGAPAGEEAGSFVIALIMASTGRIFISGDSRKRLERLKEKRQVRIFVSPT